MAKNTRPPAIPTRPGGNWPSGSQGKPSGTGRGNAKPAGK